MGQAMMRLWLFAMATAVAGCASGTPPPSKQQMQQRLDEIQARGLQDVREKREAREREAAEFSAKAQAARDESSRKTQADNDAKRQASAAAMGAALPKHRNCIMQSAARLAVESQETADLAAIAVLGACRGYEIDLRQALAIEYGDYRAGNIVASIQPRLLLWSTELVVNARAQPPASRQSHTPGSSI